MGESITAPPPEDGWTAVPFLEIVQRTQRGPFLRRWKWGKRQQGRRTLLTLREPNGKLWQVKMANGVHLRPLPE